MYKDKRKSGKLHFTQYIPNYCDFDKEEYDCDNLQELLDKNKHWLEDKKRTLVFACSGFRQLMVSSTTDEWWWVIGYVDGINLKNYLPEFSQTHYLKEEENYKLVCFKDQPNEKYIVDDINDSGNYSVTRIDNRNIYGQAWLKPEKFEELGIATQEQLDLINRAYEKLKNIDYEEESKDEVPVIQKVKIEKEESHE